jgi:hypothetical protein
MPTPPPSSAANGTITLLIAIVILSLLLVVTVRHMGSKPIIYWTLMIDILFCAAMYINSTRILGLEAELRAKGEA